MKYTPPSPIALASCLVLLLIACGSKSHTIGLDSVASTTEAASGEPGAGGGALIDLAVHDELACAVRSDRSVWCWGRAPGVLDRSERWERYNNPSVVRGLPPAKRIFLGEAGLCVIPYAGGLHCIGSSWLPLTTWPFQGAGPGSVAMAPEHLVIGRDHACGLHEGQIVCSWRRESRQEDRWWLGAGVGADDQRDTGLESALDAELGIDDGLVGESDTEMKSLPPEPARVISGLPRLTHIASSDSHLCAVAEGTSNVWCWGRSEGNPETSTGRRRETFAPTKVAELAPDGHISVNRSTLLMYEGNRLTARSLTSGRSITHDFGRSVASIYSGDHLDHGSGSTELLGVLDTSSPGDAGDETDGQRAFVSYGVNKSGQVLVRAGRNRVAVSNPVLSGVRRLVGGGSHGKSIACALTDQQRIFCWRSASPPASERPYPEAMYVLDARAHLGWIELPLLDRADEPASVVSPALSVSTAPGDQILDIDRNVYQRACALRGDGRAFCWIVGMESQSKWVPGPALGGLALGFKDLCGVTRAGELQCWHIGRSGLAFQPWEPLELSGVTSIDRRGDRFCAQHSGDRVACFEPHRDPGEPASVRARWGMRVTMRGIRALAVREDGVCGLRGAREIECHHENYRRRLFRAPVDLRSLTTLGDMFEPTGKRGGEPMRRPDEPVPLPVVAIGADGMAYRAAFHQDELRSLPSERHWRYPAPGIDWLTVAYSDRTVCGVDNTGRVHCWGWNRRGQLGRGQISRFSATPQAIALGSERPIRQLTIDEEGACATGGREIWCWGATTWDARLHPEPVRVQIPTPVVDFDVDGNNGAAVDRSGALWIWGDAGAWRRVADIASENALPVSVPLQRPVVMVRAAGDVACVLYGGRQQLDCWHKLDDAPTPIDLPGKLAELQIVDAATCARLVDGRVFCWSQPRK